MKSGDRVGRYVVLGKLAKGGMAEVWLARHSGPAGFHKLLVLKTVASPMNEDPHFVQLFLEEARLAALLNHPNVVQIFDLDTHGDEPFLAMEYLDGRNLAHIQKALTERAMALPIPLVVRIMADACAGLEYAHALRDPTGTPLNIIHRDVTPENMIITYQGQVKLLDFGIAKAAASSALTRPGTVRGKLAFLSPEQVMGRTPDRRVDIWAVGVNLYMMLTGKEPFAGSSELEHMRAILQTEPTPPSGHNPNIPPSLDSLILRALEKDPQRRYGSAGEIRLLLEEFLREQPSVGAFHLAQLMETLFPSAGDPIRSKIRTLLEMDAATLSTSPVMPLLPSGDTPAARPVVASQEVTSAAPHAAPETTQLTGGASAAGGDWPSSLGPPVADATVADGGEVDPAHVDDMLAGAGLEPLPPGASQPSAMSMLPPGFVLANPSEAGSVTGPPFPAAAAATAVDEEPGNAEPDFHPESLSGAVVEATVVSGPAPSASGGAWPVEDEDNTATRPVRPLPSSVPPSLGLPVEEPTDVAPVRVETTVITAAPSRPTASVVVDMGTGPFGRDGTLPGASTLPVTGPQPWPGTSGAHPVAEASPFGREGTLVGASNTRLEGTVVGPFGVPSTTPAPVEEPAAARGRAGFWLGLMGGLALVAAVAGVWKWQAGNGEPPAPGVANPGSAEAPAGPASGGHQGVDGVDASGPGSASNAASSLPAAAVAAPPPASAEMPAAQSGPDGLHPSTASHQTNDDADDDTGDDTEAPEQADTSDEPDETAAAAPSSRSGRRVAKPKARGALQVGSNVPATVFMDGRKVGRTPLTLTRVPVGSHRLKLVSQEGKARRTTKVEVSEGDRAQATVNFATGTLIIRVRPWAKVKVNGRAKGITPLQPLVLPAGKYRVVLENPELKVRQKHTVTIKAGATEELKIKLP